MEIVMYSVLSKVDHTIHFWYYSPIDMEISSTNQIIQEMVMT